MYTPASMPRTPVTSSVIAGLGYDPGTKILEVEFRTGRLYQYFPVPQVVYEALLNAKSLGKYFNEQIRDHYSFREVTD